MPGVDLTIEICGMSGDGTIAAGGLLNEALSLAGFSLLAFDSYPAEIRGFGRCVTRSRVGDRTRLAVSDRSHALISLDDHESRSRIPFLERDAAVFFDNRPPSYVTEDRSIAAHVEPETRLYGIPFGELAAGASGSMRGKNITALGAFSAVFGLAPDFFRDVIRTRFGPKGERIVQDNLRCFDAGHAYALENFKGRTLGLLSFPPGPRGETMALVSGNESIARGALDAGVKFYFGYPITPATPIMEFLAKALPGRGGRVLQMEDEIASIGGVLGSFYAGARAMTATSGPGLALMTELITHAVMAEIPAVIVDAQRGGPATGLPTKTEQSDLHAAVFGGPGDSLRIVLAPTDVPECYTYTAGSFGYAEKYQTPVILLTDFFLNNRVENSPLPRIDPRDTADGNLYPGEPPLGSYRRYEITESGISPRALPGMAGFMFTATGLEHTPQGTPEYGPENHMAMSAKRHRKIQGALADLPKPQAVPLEGELDLGVISWGSTFGAALEAVELAREAGLRVGSLKITSLYPYHAEIIRAFMARCADILIPELNYEGQLADLIGHLHRKDVIRLNRATGTPMTPGLILGEIKRIMKEKESRRKDKG